MGFLIWLIFVLGQFSGDLVAVNFIQLETIISKVMVRSIWEVDLTSNQDLGLNFTKFQLAKGQPKKREKKPVVRG